MAPQKNPEKLSTKTPVMQERLQEVLKDQEQIAAMARDEVRPDAMKEMVQSGTSPEEILRLTEEVKNFPGTMTELTKKWMEEAPEEVASRTAALVTYERLA